jgi:hypothetical protein
MNVDCVLKLVMGDLFHDPVSTGETAYASGERLASQLLATNPTAYQLAEWHPPVICNGR